MAEKFGYSTQVTVSAQQKAEFLEFAARTVRAAGAVTLPFFRSGTMVENKLTNGRFDPVTQADRAAEQVVREAIQNQYPSHGIMGEEYGYVAGNGLTWVIDPIDGTRAFMSGMLHWGVLLGLFDGDEVVVGAMYQPYTDELFLGDCEHAFFERNGARSPLRTSTCSSLSDAVLATTGYEWFSDIDRQQFDQLRNTAKLCRVGGDCYIYGMVGMGTIDLGTDASLNPYDIQALIPIVRGAGGVVTTYDGGNPSMGGAILASANEGLHEHALRAIKSA